MKRFVLGCSLAVFVWLMSVPATAAPISVTTGDLGTNVIDNAGAFAVALAATTPSNVLPATIDVIYGLWNSPAVSVSVFFNGSLVGSFLADQGFISPGPEFASFNVAGLLLAGANTISFNGFGANTGDYVVNRVTLNYDDSAVVPEPAGLALALLGLGAVAARRADLRRNS